MSILRKVRTWPALLAALAVLFAACGGDGDGNQLST